MPEECTNLEGALIWEAEGIVKGIQDFYTGKKNPLVELYKVILTQDDPRYLNPNPKWSFDEEKCLKQ